MRKRDYFHAHRMRSCLEDYALQDLGFSGFPFTWCNNHEEPNTVRAHLDRGCGDTGWVQLFPSSRLHHIHTAASDHLALTVELEPNSVRRKDKQTPRFRFEAAWT
ncbi:UNVERIFIED_CONTAM: hypothetical protein Slati_2123300 [Sesamum latifolium]|uniref:Endonuclease/exonuclease/phosphatase domain-containing protein n=1 Tax=Sesamum latifolium TaxID=2727402 RepID=A0AAW2WRY7_9LAMI